MDIWYGDGPMGIPGDDDGGETSSWYVFSAMGFYPVCPGSPVYEIGSPIFAKTTIRMGNGKEFTIVADHVSAQNKYIQSAQLNGRPLNRAVVSAQRYCERRDADSGDGAGTQSAVGRRPRGCTPFHVKGDRENRNRCRVNRRVGNDGYGNCLI